MSRGKILQESIESLKLAALLPGEGAEGKGCPCGLHCEEICYRKEFDDLIDLLACDDDALDNSPRSITVSTSGMRVVKAGDMRPIPCEQIVFKDSRYVSDAVSACSRLLGRSSMFAFGREGAVVAEEGNQAALQRKSRQVPDVTKKSSWTPSGR